jgi:hypothetical protein
MPIVASKSGQCSAVAAGGLNLRAFNTTRHDQFGEKDLDDFVALISGFAAHL